MTDESPAAAVDLAAKQARDGVEANRKGKLLERAVKLVETAILRTVPGADQMPMTVQSNKRLNVDGVRHEVDLYVRLVPAAAYESIFIFECKNWEEDAVSKNDIIIFSEKIRVTQAQRGYFVARRFTSDAIAQARQDRRIEIIHATIEEFEVLRTVTDMIVAVLGLPKTVEISMIGPDGVLQEVRPDTHEKRRLGGSELIVGPEGSESLHAYIVEWIRSDDAERKEPLIGPNQVPGIYEVTSTVTNRFTNCIAKIRVSGRDDIEISGLVLKMVRHVWFGSPQVQATVDVGGRGRAIHFAPIAFEGSSFEMVLGFPEGK